MCQNNTQDDLQTLMWICCQNKTNIVLLLDPCVLIADPAILFSFISSATATILVSDNKDTHTQMPFQILSN